MLNKIVVRFVDGGIKKGTTADFFPNKCIFHLTENVSGDIQEININSLKAIYFVKSFDGNPDYNDNLHTERVGFGKKIHVLFNDGEVLVGYTQGFSPGRPSFIVFPSDPGSNNEKVFVVTAATSEIKFI